MSTHPSSTAHGQRIKELIQPAKSVMQRRRGEITGQGLGGERILTFPEDLSSHFMALIFHRFHYDTKSNAKTSTHNKTILLPVPVNLQEQIQTQYNDSELGAIGGELSDMLARGSASEMTAKMQSFISGAGELMSGVMSQQGRANIANTFAAGGRGNAGGIKLVKTNERSRIKNA